MYIATVASDTVWKDVSKNIEQTERHVAEVLRLYPKTQIILFPEISLAGFVVDSSNVDAAETMDGYGVQEVCRIACQHQVALICGYIEQNSASAKPYNTQFVVSKTGELLAAYRKNHLFTQSDEAKFYSAGQELVVFQLEGWKCGLSTCFDIRFPRLFEAYKQAGVECMFSGFNWVEGRNKAAIMETMVKARAQENQFFFAAVDRSGSDPNTTYYGTSVITNPYSESIGEKQGIYCYAELSKDDIASLSQLLPLHDSFKEKYHLQL